MAETRRRINQGKVEIDFEESALIVHFEVELVQKDEFGRVLETGDRKSDAKRIKIKNLSAEKDLAQLASDIVDKCKYIHPSRVEEIEQLLIRLRKHNLSVPAANNNSSANNVDSKEKSRDSKLAIDTSHPKKSGEEKKIRKEKEEDLLPDAAMNQLDDYLDMLYQVAGKSEKDKEEGLKMQIKGTGMILKLCHDVMNLEQLIQNGTVMGALTRVLQEEYKKSVDLTFNIIRIFLAFSNFVEMHGLMSNYRIGLLTMKAIEFEIKKVEHRETENKEREVAYDAEIAAAKKSAQAEELQQVLDKIRKNKEKESNAAKRQQKKQDKLLFVSFYVLLNLAEDVSVERKMVKKSLVDSLACMLDRSYGDLLILVVTFLKKLSVYEENKDAIKSIHLINKLAKFIPCSSQALVVNTLRLLFNLSFDMEVREQIMRCGMVPKLILLLKTPSLRGRTLRLLYHLSVDDRCKSMFTYTEGIPLLTGMIVNFPQNHLAKELAALAVNLCLNSRNAEMMVANKGLNYLMDRLSTTRDPLLLKIIRNLSQWTFNLQKDAEQSETPYKYRALWPPHIKMLVEISRTSENHDILVESIGCLANMTSSDLPANATWAKLFRDNNLLSLFAKLLVPGMAQNDLLLEIVMLISAAASEAQACDLLASTNIITSLYQLWIDKTDDVEIVLQLIHCFHKLFLFESSREEAMYNTRVVTNMIECLGHRNAAVRNAADAATELVLELDRRDGGALGALGAQIRKKRFEGYNQMWLSQMGGLPSTTHNSELNSPNLQAMAQMGMMLQPGMMSRADTGDGIDLMGPQGMMMDDHDSMVSMGAGGMNGISEQFDTGLDWRSFNLAGGEEPMGMGYERSMKSYEDQRGYGGIQSDNGGPGGYPWGDRGQHSPSDGESGGGMDESWDNRFSGK